MCAAQYVERTNHKLYRDVKDIYYHVKKQTEIELHNNKNSSALHNQLFR